MAELDLDPSRHQGPPILSPTTEPGDPYRKIENLHVFLWLFKDMCWCFDFHTLGMIMVVPTVIAAFVITWIQRKHSVELIHNIAVSLWICANATWMTGEFYYNDTTRPFALIFFVSGIALLTMFYAQVVFLKLTKKRN